jgi:predicted dehydrogenase
MIRLAIIGCGRIVSQGHAAGLKEVRAHCRTVALADVAPPNLELVGEMLGVPSSHWYTDHRELLRRERGRVDVVVLALPHKLHKPILMDTAKAGFAILTEKPLTVDLPEARAVFRVLRKGKTFFGIVHNYWRAPHMLAIVKAVRDGKIGEPFLYRTEGIGGSYWPGAKTYRSSWRSEAKIGGRGCLLDNGYHQIYSAERIVGSPIVSACARVERYNRDYTVEDTALALLRHRNGATTSLLVGWSVSGGGQGVMEVHGTRGSISQTRKEIEGTAYYNNKSAKWVPLKPVKTRLSPYGAIYADFVRAFESGKRYVDAHAAAWNNMAILEACYRSAKTRREEKVERWRD